MITDNELLWVPLPDGVRRMECNYAHVPLLHYCMDDLSTPDNWTSIPLPPGDWEFIGVVPGMTEEQAAKISDWACGLYRDYSYKDVQRYSFHTALESLSSRMEAARVYTVNPYGKSIDDLTDANGRAYNTNISYDDWHAAQSRTSPTWAVLRDIKYPG